MWIGREYFSFLETSLPRKLWHQGRGIVIKMNHSGMTSEIRPPPARTSAAAVSLLEVGMFDCNIDENNSFHTFPCHPTHDSKTFLLSLPRIFAATSQNSSLFEQKQKKKPGSQGVTVVGVQTSNMYAPFPCLSNSLPRGVYGN